MSAFPPQRLALAAVLLLALALRVWGLEQNGWGAEYYSAAVLSMGSGWHNFLYAAFDPAGFISVDKPPLALWLQVASARLLGFRPFSLLLPQVLAGVASVWLLHHLARRSFGEMPALLSAFLLATTPVWVAVNRTNNMDSVLLLALLLAAWALLKAADEGSRRHLLLAMAGIGIAFNVKMLAAYIVLPTFFLTYFLCAPLPWRRRAADLLWACVVVAAVSSPWVLAVELTPADERPYVGSSRTNSVMDLILGHNAARRFTSARASDASGAGAASAGRMPAEATPAEDLGDDTRSSARAIVQRAFVRSPTGPLRLASGQLAAQVAWLLPFAIAALALGARNPWRSWRIPAGAPPDPARTALLFWLGWTVTYWIVYGYLGGIVHFYYLSTLAPAFAALAGVGAVALWRRHRESGHGATLLPLMLIACAAWQLHVEASALGWPFEALWSQREAWLVGLHALLVGGTVVAATCLFASRDRRVPAAAARWLGHGGLWTGSVAILALPLAWTSSSVLLPGQGVMPSADLYRLLVDVRATDAMDATRFGQSADTTKLVAFLKANHDGERFILATSTTQLAAPVILATGAPVMARGGFHGLDAAVTVESFARFVEAREVRFAMLGDVASVSRRMGADRAGKSLAEWIRSHGKRVDPALWRGQRMSAGTHLYDLRPDKDRARPPSPSFGPGSA